MSDGRNLPRSPGQTDLRRFEPDLSGDHLDEAPPPDKSLEPIIPSRNHLASRERAWVKVKRLFTTPRRREDSYAIPSPLSSSPSAAEERRGRTVRPD